MSSNLVIRAAEPSDAARCHELHTASVRGLCADHYPPPVIDGWLANRSPAGYLTPIASGALFVAELDGSIVGFGEASAGTISAVYVDPRAAMRGVGAAILKHAIAMARCHHDGPIRLESSLNACVFYAQPGFREISSSTVRRNNVTIPVVVMEYDGA